MKSLHRPGFVLLTLMIAAALWRLSAVAAPPPTGSATLYMPLLGRAEPTPADYLGLAYSQYPSFPQSPMPVAEIYTVRGDGSALTRLTTNEWYDISPRWSPDGSMILWTQQAEMPGTVGTYYSAMWLMNTDGTNPRQLADYVGHERGFWSPDGSHIFIIAYDNSSGDPYAGTDVYITTPTAITPTLILSDTAWGGDEWSPDGAYLAYATYDANAYDIYRMNPDGTGMTLLVEDADQYFEWSPDSAWLVYHKTVAGNQDVYIIRADGSETRRLTTDPAVETFTGWVEQGARLLVTRRTGDTTSVTDLVTVEDGIATPFITQSVQIQGVAPDGGSVAYAVAPTAGVTTTQLYLKATTGAPAQPISPPIECGAPICGFNFNGWSATGRYLAYAFYRSFTPTQGFSQVYVASLEGGTPTYAPLESQSSGLHWLPYGDWFGVFARPAGAGNGRYLMNARTGEKILLPTAEDGWMLIPSEWRYDGS